jgi:hypothetical protein
MLLLPMIALKHDQIRPIREMTRSAGGIWMSSFEGRSLCLELEVSKGLR